MSAVSGELGAEDVKLVILARSARARTQASEGAAVRDSDGRTYVATTVALASLQLSALQVAVAMAVSSGALGIEAAAIVGEQSHDTAGTDALYDISHSIPVFLARVDGTVVVTTS